MDLGVYFFEFIFFGILLSFLNQSLYLYYSGLLGSSEATGALVDPCWGCLWGQKVPLQAVGTKRASLPATY